MLPHIATESSITFFAQGAPWVINFDHANFALVRQLLLSGTDDVERLVDLTDIRVAVGKATDGRGTLTDAGLSIDGVLMPDAWVDQAMDCPDAVRVLLVKAGDTVRVSGDDDAPDGIYTVGDIDDADTTKRVMVESDDGFFGFIANASVKEVLVAA